MHVGTIGSVFEMEPEGSDGSRKHRLVKQVQSQEFPVGMSYVGDDSYVLLFPQLPSLI